jgi:hypothetical protein
MRLSKHLNARSKISRRAETETENFGETSLSRHFPAIMASRQQRIMKEQIVVAKQVGAPVRVIRRGMNI